MAAGVEFGLTPEQELLRETTRRFLSEQMPISAIRAMIDSEESTPNGWWQRGCDLGWTSMLVPESLGGGSVTGFGLLDLAVISEELGRGLAPGPFLTTNVAAAALGAAGQDRSELRAITTGDVVVAWCDAESGQPWRSVVTSCESDRNGYVLTGVKAPVEAAGEADLFLVTTSSSRGLSQVLVPADAVGVTIEPMASIDLVRRYARVRFDGVHLSPSALVGELGGADSAIDHQRQLAAVLQSADTLGAATHVFELTLEWLSDRLSFGRPLSSYQALKHRVADAKQWLEVMAALVADAAHAVQHGRGDAADLASAAASYTGERATDLVQDCVQLHGGMGVTWEHDLHLYLRRVTTNRFLHGTPADHRERLTALLDGPVMSA